MFQNKQCEKHSANFKAEGIPSQSLGNSHLEVIHSSAMTPSPPSPIAPGFTAEHHSTVWNIPLSTVALVPSCVPTQPLAQPPPTLWGGGWAERGKKEQVPKLEDNKLTPIFFLALSKKG